MPPKGRIVVDDRYCKGCEICVSECPQDVLELARDRMTPKRVSPSAPERLGCTGCGICAIVCPEAAITVYRETQPKPNQGGG